MPQVSGSWAAQLCRSINGSMEKDFCEPCVNRCVRFVPFAHNNRDRVN